MTSKINKNDDILVTIKYDKNPDDVLFSLIIFYNFNIVATKAFQYIEYNFKIWDLFNNFDDSTTAILLRVSLFDPNFFMPS